MKLERKKNTLKNILWGAGSKVLLMIFPFIIRTTILKAFGENYLGLSGLFSSILQVLALSELGLSSAIGFCLYEPLAKEDNEKVRRLLNYYKLLYRMIGFMILAAGVCCIPFLPRLIHKTSIDVNINVLYLLTLFNTALGYFLFPHKYAIIAANQRLDLDSKVRTATAILVNVMQILVLALLKNYYLYQALFLASTIINSLAISRIADKLYPQFQAAGKLDKRSKETIWKKVTALLVDKVGGILSNSADNIVIAAFLSLAVVGRYNNYFQIIATLFGFLEIYYNAMTAGIGNSIVTESIEKNKQTFYTLFFMQAWLITWCTVCLICLYQPFMELWVGKEFLLGDDIVVLLAVYFYTWKVNDIVSIYRQALGLWDRDKYRPLVAAVVNLGVNLLLVRYIGLKGVILSTVLANLFVNFPWAVRSLYKYYFSCSPGEYYRQFGKYLFLAILIAATTYYACARLPIHAVLPTLLSRGVICVIIPNIIYFLLFRNSSYFSNMVLWIRSVIKI